MRRLVWIALALTLLAAVVVPSAGPAAAAPSPATHASAISRQGAHFFDKTRFLLHMGIAYYAFHHWVIKPWQAGDFKTGSPHRVSTIAKAAVATLFAYHEVRVAWGIAEKSKDPTLQFLVKPVNALLGSANKVATEMKKGSYNPSDVSSLVNNVNSVGSKASSKGATIKDIAYKIPGL